MPISYLKARLGECCPDCGSPVRVHSAKKLLKGNPKASIIVRCDCDSGTYRLSKADRSIALRMLNVGAA